MATTKKTSTTKKLSTKTSKSAKNAPRAWSWRFSLITFGIYTIVAATLVVAAFSAAHFITNNQNQQRLSQIQTVYKNLNLGDSYVAQKTNLFGDKRVYEWDKSRTYSSSIEYVHAATVSETVKDLDAKIKATGFEFINEPYPGGVSTQYHYKSANGEYLRLTVSSKPYDDAVQNAFILDKNATNNLRDKYDINAGPSNVVIKVNIDDNNE